MPSATGSLDYFFALSTSGFGYGAALYFSRIGTTDTYNLGINESNTSGEAIVYTGATYNTGDEVFVVIKYEFNAAGNSVAHLFVNPTISGTTEPASDEDTSSIALEDEANRSEFTLLKINANSNSRTPRIAIDEIRIGTSWEDVVTTTSGPTLDVRQLELSSFKVYPNPARDYITIKSDKVKIASIDLYSVLGKQVLSQKKLIDNTLNVSSLSEGVYFIKIKGEDNSSVTKRVVIN